MQKNGVCNWLKSAGLRLIRSLSCQLIPSVGTLVAVALMLFAYHAWAAPGPAHQSQTASNASTGLLSYQGYLTDASGEPLHGDVDITFRLYGTPSGGTALWTEAHTGANAVPVEDGLFNVMLGSLNPIPNDVWSSGARYLSLQVGDDAEMAPRETIGSVPTALTVPNGSITENKIANRAITASKISDDAILSNYRSRGDSGEFSESASTIGDTTWVSFSGTEVTITVSRTSRIILNATAGFVLSDGAGHLRAGICRDNNGTSAYYFTPDVTSVRQHEIWSWNYVDTVAAGTYTYMLCARGPDGITAKWFRPAITLVAIPGQ
jgi:hypothetical protein